MKRIFWKFYDPAADAGKGGKSPELEVLERVNEKVDQIKKDYEKEINVLKEAKTEAETKYKDYESKVAELNKELSEKGATLGQIQQEVKELQAKSGRIGVSIPEGKLGVKELLLKEWEANIENFKNFRPEIHNDKNPFPVLQTKAAGTMTTAGNITGVSISAVPTISNEFAVRGRQLVHARDLIRTINTTTGLYMFIRQNIPAGDGSVAATTQPGATKPKRDYDNTMVTVNARYRAGTVDIAAEMEQDIPGMGQYVTEELTEDYLRTETFDFTEALVSAATGSAALPAGVTVAAEKIPHWVANLEQNNYQPDTMVVRPRRWAHLLNTKPSDYSVPGGYLVLPNGDIIFAGLRLTKCSTNAISDDDVLMGDFRRALIVQKSGEGFRVQMFNTHDQAVYANLITFRGEARAELAILRPDAFLRGTF